MKVTVARVSMAEAATTISTAITVIQYTLGLAVVVVLVHAISNINTAVARNVVARIPDYSLWPTFFRTDSTAFRNTGFRISLFSNFFLLSGIFITVVGVITPLGLKDGPFVLREHRLMNASYIPDMSPIGLATSPREGYTHSRLCGTFGEMPCPGNEDIGNTSQIAPSITNIFSSTSQGPFNMQFRRYYKGTLGHNPILLSKLSTTESLILREGIFAIDGLIVDLTESPGIGFWNHTLPTLQGGGTWSQEVLWLEPVSSCVNTNLTIDYELVNNSVIPFVEHPNLTDRGGFTNLTHDYPTMPQDGQHIDVYAHAYKGAVLANYYAMLPFNMSRNDSYVGRTFPLDVLEDANLIAGQMWRLNLAYMRNATSNTTASCQRYDHGDTANITNVAVHCGIVLGPPERTDGGDPRLPGDNSTWTQSLHVCASATRASIQRVDFSFNGTLDLSALRISRQLTNNSVLWAVENAALNISDVDLFWGRVADSYEHDPSLSTIRSEFFYLPAGASDIFDYWGMSFQPSNVPALAWFHVYNPVPYEIIDYTAQNNFALLSKFRSLTKADSVNGPAQISNLIWTDLIANNIVGSDSDTTLLVARNEPSVSYNLIYGIPAVLLLVFWSPFFLTAVFMLLTGTLMSSYIRDLLDCTSVGRVVIGDSVVKGPSLAQNAPPRPQTVSPLADGVQTTPDALTEMKRNGKIHIGSARTTGCTPSGPGSSVTPNPKPEFSVGEEGLLSTLPAGEK